MRKIGVLTTVIGILIFASFSFASDFKESALSWQKQAKDTRGAVVSVADELGKMGDKGNEYAKDLINDAVKWLGEGDNHLSAGDEEMKKEEFEKASFNYNMAWQYYVKAATAGLNAKRILSE